jgi:hypothetical protein
MLIISVFTLANFRLFSERFRIEIRFYQLRTAKIRSLFQNQSLFLIKFIDRLKKSILC